MSAMASSTVSTVPSLTAFFSSSSVIRRRGYAPRVSSGLGANSSATGASMLRS